jgi:hypothetical protein
MENDATNLPRGMVIDMGSCHTLATAPTEMTRSNLSSGVAASATASATPDPSSPISADEGQRLARIARDRANRFMVSGPDVDFLLDVLARLNP